MGCKNLEKELIALRDKKRAEGVARFFKTGDGGYSAHDKFLGLRVPTVREICKKYKDLSFSEIQKLLENPWHEVRLAGLIILSNQAKKVSPRSVLGEKVYIKKFSDFYLKNTKYVNNWDLVDVSAEHTVGNYLKYLNQTQRIKFLEKYIRSKDLWERRIAIVSTFALIKEGEYATTFAIAEKLLDDKEDLIHKATGWMLRECGKKCSEEKLSKFLEKNIHKLPRTTLRYAIERFPEPKRKHFLKI